MTNTYNTMRLSLVSITLAGLLASCNGSKNGEFELKGQFKNTNGELIFLEKLAPKGPVVVDSTVINENGEFEFANYSPKIGFYRVRVDKENFAMLVLDSADKVNITGDLKDLSSTYKATGSAETDLFVKYNSIVKHREMRLDSLQKVFMAVIEPFKMSTEKVDSVSRTLQEPYSALMNAIEYEMVAVLSKNTNMYASMMGIQSLDPDKNIELYDKLDTELKKKYPNDYNVNMFHEMLERSRATAIGAAAPEINLPAPDGKEVALSSLKGKVVLIDFWASWCKPCRAEMPNVVKAYAKFKAKGFEVYGVSLDQDKDHWVEAIAKDGITWIQVSDLRPDNEFIRRYNVETIPMTFLLDKEGKIIAKNLRGEELEKKLAEVLN